jgi:hypothetical protein
MAKFACRQSLCLATISFADKHNATAVCRFRYQAQAVSEGSEVPDPRRPNPNRLSRKDWNVT